MNHCINTMLVLQGELPGDDLRDDHQRRRHNNCSPLWIPSLFTMLFSREHGHPQALISTDLADDCEGSRRHDDDGQSDGRDLKSGGEQRRAAPQRNESSSTARTGMSSDEDNTINHDDEASLSFGSTRNVSFSAGATTSTLDAAALVATTSSTTAMNSTSRPVTFETEVEVVGTSILSSTPVPGNGDCNNGNKQARKTADLPISSNPSPTKQPCAVTPAPPPRQQQEYPGCALYDLVLERKWHRAMNHLREHLVDAQYQDGDNFETPLHMACQNSPSVRVVRAIIEAWPDALFTTSRDQGRLPIHVACRYNTSIEVLRELVRHKPETAAFQTKWGETPLQALWDTREPIRSAYNHVFWNKINTLLESVAKSRGHYSSSPPSTAAVSVGNDHEHREEQELFLVHAAVSIGSLGCPSEVLEHALQDHSEQVLKADSNGMYPLHLAVAPTSWTRAQRRKYRPRELQTISRILKFHPDAARIPLRNMAACCENLSNSKQTSTSCPLYERYPLHAALVNGHTWYGGIQSLWQAAPDLLLQRDAITGLYPFQLAAVASDEDPTAPVVGHLPKINNSNNGINWSSNSTQTADIRKTKNSIDLDSIYGLLRARPDAIVQGYRCGNNVDNNDVFTCDINLGTDKVIPTPQETENKASAVFDGCNFITSTGNDVSNRDDCCEDVTFNKEESMVKKTELEEDTMHLFGDVAPRNDGNKGCVIT